MINVFRFLLAQQILKSLAANQLCLECCENVNRMKTWIWVSTAAAPESSPHVVDHDCHWIPMQSLHAHGVWNTPTHFHFSERNYTLRCFEWTPIENLWSERSVWPWCADARNSPQRASSFPRKRKHVLFC